MRHNVRKFWLDDSGFVISAELILISTILVIGMIVGLTEIQAAVVAELNDVSCAIGSLNQSYVFRGFSGCKGTTFGSVYYDNVDACDVCNISLCSGSVAVAEGGAFGGGYGYGGAYGGGAFGGGAYSGGVISGSSYSSSKTIVAPQMGVQSSTVVVPTIPDNAPVLTPPVVAPTVETPIIDSPCSTTTSALSTTTTSDSVKCTCEPVKPACESVKHGPAMKLPAPVPAPAMKVEPPKPALKPAPKSDAQPVLPRAPAKLY